MDTENTETAVKKSNKKSKAQDDTSEPMQEDKPTEVVDGYTPESVKKKKKKKEKRIDEEEINGGTNGVNKIFDLGEDGTVKKKNKKKGVDPDDAAGVQTAVEVKKKKKKSKRGDE